MYGLVETLNVRLANIVGLAVALLLTLLLPQAEARAQTEGQGVIFGQVINQTTGEPVPELPVSLSTFAEGTLQPGQNTVTDAEGRFEFPDVSSDPEVVYAVSSAFSGISYSTGRMSFEEDSVGIEVRLDVYEPTSDQSLARIRSRGLILTDVAPTRGEIGLLDIYVFEMRENRVLVADEEGRAVTFPVPRNASRVIPLPETSYNMQTALIEGATVYGTEPLMPGEQSATLSYTIPYTNNRLSLELLNAYETGLFRILIPQTVSAQNEEITVEAAGFEYAGEEVIGPQTYDVWVRENVSPNDRLRIVYGGLQHSRIKPNTLNKMVPGAVAGLVAIAAVGIVYLLVRGRRLYAPRPLVLAPQLASSLEAQRTDLIEQLQALETAHSSGIVDDKQYREYRQLILEQIRLVNRQMRGEGVEE